MFNKEIIKQTKNILEEFFEKAGISCDIEIKPKDEKVMGISLRVNEPQILIGKGGETLFVLQTLLRKILRKNVGDFFVDLDINDYKKKKIDYLKELARNLADEVSLSKKEKMLQPMPAYERRIIHLELLKREDVKTESIGERFERRVVIKPA
ncbi:KH domain-containing protein [bacterium]|nr:KH domain-containing protein [bacterium]